MGLEEDVKRKGITSEIIRRLSDLETKVRKILAGGVGGGSSGGRELLTADRTYHVRTDGNDTNTGLTDSSAGAFLTIQKAINTAATLDSSIFNVIIQVGDGTYNESLTAKQMPGSGTITIQGNTSNKAAVLINPAASAFTATGVTTTYILQYLKLGTTAGFLATIVVGLGSIVNYGNIDFASSNSRHMYVYDGGVLTCIASYDITGGATTHWTVQNSAIVRCQSKTITISNTPAFSTAFVVVERVASSAMNNLTFSGSATGKRYEVNLNGALNTNGGGANYFPGDAAGSTATGGQYA